MLVEREVVANLFLEGGLVKVLPRAKISADGMFNSGHPRWTNQPWQASQYLCQETGLQGRGRNVPSGRGCLTVARNPLKHKLLRRRSRCSWSAGIS